MIIGDPILTPIDPLALIVSVQEAKDKLIIDYPVDDDMLKRDIISATQTLQKFTGLAFMPSSVKVTISQRSIRGEHNYITIPYANNAVLVTTGYELTGGDIIVTDDSIVTLEYTAGETKEWMKEAVLMYVCDLYTNRGEEGGNVGESAKSLCAPHISHGGWF